MWEVTKSKSEYGVNDNIEETVYLYSSWAEMIDGLQSDAIPMYRDHSLSINWVNIKDFDAGPGPLENKVMALMAGLDPEKESKDFIQELARAVDKLQAATKGV